MKKIMLLLLCAALIMTTLAGCSKKEDNDNSNTEATEEPSAIVTADESEESQRPTPPALTVAIGGEAPISCDPNGWSWFDDESGVFVDPVHPTNPILYKIFDAENTVAKISEPTVYEFAWERTPSSITVSRWDIHVYEGKEFPEENVEAEKTDKGCKLTVEPDKVYTVRAYWEASDEDASHGDGSYFIIAQNKDTVITPSENYGQNEETETVGGWDVPEDTILDEEITDIYNKATATLTGAHYEPLCCLGLQVVSGMNYAILCKGSFLHNPEALEHLAVMFIYADLNGKAEVTKIVPVDFGRVANGENFVDAACEIQEQTMMGGWYTNITELRQYSEDYVYDDDTIDILDIYGHAGAMGNGYNALMCLEEQVVSGKNYCFLAEDVTNEEENALALVYIYENTDGESRLSGTVAFDIAALADAQSVEIAHDESLAEENAEQFEESAEGDEE